MIELKSSAVTEIFTAFGKLRVSAEDVATDATEQAVRISDPTRRWENILRDQCYLPMALAGGGSFTAVSLNMHAKTNMQVIAVSAGPVRCA